MPEQAALRIDKSALSVDHLFDQGDEKAFWSAKSHGERLGALEAMRQIVYGYDPVTTRLQRVLEVTELKRG